MSFGDQTHVFMITRHAFYWPRHLPSPQSKGVLLLLFCVCGVWELFKNWFCFVFTLYYWSIYSSNAATTIVLFYFVCFLYTQMQPNTRLPHFDHFSECCPGHACGLPAPQGYMWFVLKSGFLKDLWQWSGLLFRECLVRDCGSLRIMVNLGCQPD